MTMPNLNVYIEDGRWGLEHSPFKYDLIIVDAYRAPYIPWQMTTQEFFRIAFDHLTEDGVLAINVGRTPSDRRLIDGLATTIATLFPSLYVMDVPGTLNSVVYATRRPSRAENLAVNLLNLSQQEDVHPLLLTAMQVALANLRPGYHVTTVFTDDLAPIEWITNEMVIDFVLHGDLGTLQ